MVPKSERALRGTGLRLGGPRGNPSGPEGSAELAQYPALPGWPRPVPAGSPAPFRAAGGPAASWERRSAVAAPCRGIYRCSGCSEGYPPLPPTVPPASDTPGGRESGPASRSCRRRPAPPPPAREGTAPNAWWRAGGRLSKGPTAAARDLNAGIPGELSRVGLRTRAGRKGWGRGRTFRVGGRRHSWSSPRSSKGRVGVGRCRLVLPGQRL